MISEQKTSQVVVSVAEAPRVETPTTREEGAIVKLLLHDGMGAEQYWLSHTEFPPGSEHRPHRHPNRDQAIYLLGGTMIHTDADGNTRRLSAGEVVHVPAGEWHALDNDGDEPAFTLALLGGTGDVAVAGYELRRDVEG